MYALWRGGKLIGSFEEIGPVMHHDRRAGAFGILVPSEAIESVSSMMQTRVAILPHSPTFQDSLPIEWIGDPLEPVPPMYRSSGALEPMDPETARGVPPENVYEILDDHGTHIDVHMVTLQLHRFANVADAEEWRSANGIRGDAREFWMVTFASPPPSEALKPPATPSSLVE